MAVLFRQQLSMYRVQVGWREDILLWHNHWLLHGGGGGACVQGATKSCSLHVQFAEAVHTMLLNAAKALTCLTCACCSFWAAGLCRGLTGCPPCIQLGMILSSHPGCMQCKIMCHNCVAAVQAGLAQMLLTCPAKEQIPTCFAGAL